MVECRFHTGEGELALDNAEVELPRVREDPAHPTGRVVPALARSASGVAAAALVPILDQLATWASENLD